MSNDAQQLSACQPPRNRPASLHVLGTTELLETILLGLPMQDLLLDQRVCRSWRALITSSIRLQQALFLEPVPYGNVSYLDWRLDDKDFYDDSRAKLALGEHLRGPERDRMPTIYPSHWGKTRHDAGAYHVFVNPLLLRLFPVLDKNGIYYKQETKDLPTPAQNETASWRGMFFVQPPVNWMAVEWDSGSSDDEDDEGTHPADWTINSVVKASDAKGLTMQELFWRLEGIGRPAWIEGREMWEEYRCAEDLERVVMDVDDSSPQVKQEDE